MKRPVLAVLLAACMMGWVAAEPPANELTEPPVRLRKKKRPAPDQEQPPVKPETPPKKLDDAAKPRPGEDERLDDRDDLNLPGPGGDEQEVLRRVTRNARLSEERLANRELDEATRQVQDDILEDLDRLIERAGQPPPDGQASQNARNDSPGGGQQRRSSWRLGRQRSRRTQTAGQRTPGGRMDSAAQNSSRNGRSPTGGPSAGGKTDRPEGAFDLWGHLPERERAIMNREMDQKFMDKYDELTRQYYRIIAEKSRRKK